MGRNTRAGSPNLTVYVRLLPFLKVPIGERTSAAKGKKCFILNIAPGPSSRVLYAEGLTRSLLWF